MENAHTQMGTVIKEECKIIEEKEKGFISMENMQINLKVNIQEILNKVMENIMVNVKIVLGEFDIDHILKHIHL